MKAILQELRTIFEYERALYGATVPLAEDDEVRMVDHDHQPPLSTESTTMLGTENGRTFERAGDASMSPYERVHALIPRGSPLLEMTSLDEVERYVRETVLIPLDASRTNPVFGVGNPDADLLVIGEAPGADEDRQGEPFVGRAGQLLNKILASVEFRREEVYIANILKSRPPKNRNPLPEEVEAHVPILFKQIALIRPKVVLCVGKTSGTTLLNQQTTLGALRQKFHDFHGLPVLVTYHPAALLRNSQWKRPTWDDVRLLRQRFDELVGTAELA